MFSTTLGQLINITDLEIQAGWGYQKAACTANFIKSKLTKITRLPGHRGGGQNENFGMLINAPKWETSMSIAHARRIRTSVVDTFCWSRNLRIPPWANIEIRLQLSWTNLWSTSLSDKSFLGWYIYFLKTMKCGNSKPLYIFSYASSSRLYPCQ